MTALADRVRGLREARRWSQEQLAQEVSRRGFKLGQSAIGNIEAGRVERPKSIVQLAQALDVSPDWLQTGRGLRERTDFRGLDHTDIAGEGAGDEDGMPPGNTVPAPDAPPLPYRNQMPRDVPILGTTAGGGGEQLADFEFNGEVVDFVRRPPRLIGRTDIFATFVHGDSVSPWRESGQLVYVERAKPPRPGDYVVIELRPRSGDRVRPALVKKLLATTPTKLRLRQYTPPRDFEIDRRRVLHVFRVLDWDELMGV